MTKTDRTGAYVPESSLDHGGRSAWGAIFAGTVIGLAIFAVLSLLGVGIGLTAIELDANDPLSGVPTASPIWLFISQVVSLGAGGYVAGRLAGVLHRKGTILHGATVWALSTLAAAWLAVGAGVGLFNMAGATLSTSASAVSTTASKTGSAVQAVLPDDLNLPDLAVSEIGLEDLPAPVATRLREAGVTPEDFREEAREAFRSVISRAEQARARQAISGTALDVIRSPRDAASELQDLADTLLGGENAVLSEEDRVEAIRVMERRLGLTREEALAYVDQVETQIDEVRAEVQTTIDEAQQVLEDTQAAAIDAAVTAALLAALASVLGLIAAAAGAYMGRPVEID